MESFLIKIEKSFDIYEGHSVGERDNQEDCSAMIILDGSSAILMVLADGMGGHEYGEIASNIAVNTFLDCFIQNTIGEIPKRLKLALLMANEAMADEIRLHPEKDGMGTTLVAAHISDAGLHWISVGDSLLMIVQKGAVQQLNQDHSMAPIIEQRFLDGKLTREAADKHPERNNLLSVLSGLYSPDMIDCPDRAYPLNAYDRIVVASDGLQTLSLAEVADVCRREFGAKGCVDNLLEEVAEKGRPYQDNTTIQIAVLGSATHPVLIYSDIQIVA
jgi:serine/threonine protein phosphatase PrpC